MAHSICSVPNCLGSHYGRGLCNKHWQRQYKAAKRLPPKPRYLLNESGCWIWQGHINVQGYGMAPTGKRNRRRPAHRVIFEEFRGPIPAGLELDHLCRVTACVNPSHLEPVTHAENLRRGYGIASQNRSKTHCYRGHPFTPENTIHYAQGPNKVPSRRCRLCNQVWRAAKRAQSA